MTLSNRTNTISCLIAGFVLLLSSAGLSMAETQARPAFKGPARLTTNDGHVRLQWLAAAPNAIYEVQQAVRPGFENPDTIYRGPDLATFISGLKDGVYYYRFRVEDGDWSDTVTLTVSHYSLQFAFALSGLGAVVFFLTVIIVLRGANKNIQE